ncbi:MAG: sodium:solute symporter family protein [Bacteroidota bacterium]
MNLELIDWSLIVGLMVIYAVVGIWVTKRSGTSSSEYFLSGRNMPWLLLGVSMVATTFSIDTPNLVTNIVRVNGISGNWVWWAFLLTGMLTVFIYAKLWRRSHMSTDNEFYEIRYSGKPAAILRAFRSIYLGFFFNIVIMASVTLAAIKVGAIMLGLSPIETIIIAGGVTVVYSAMGGLLGVLLTDFIQFIIAMIGAIAAAVVAVQHPKVGGLHNLLTHPDVISKLSFLPDFNNSELLLVVLIIPFAVQWWSVWYPGSEPGGGGFVVQRMFAAKDAKNAIGATLLFNAAHYAVRPWPWIIVALASILVFPDLQSIKTAFPNVDPAMIGNDMAYPAMLTYLPPGLLGLAIASLIAAYMSTIATSLNWGSSYIVYDCYKRFIKPHAEEKELVTVGRISTVVMMICASILSLYLQTALQAFNILLQIGAGTGLLFILRWFWCRINAFSEISAMGASFVIALVFLVKKNFDLDEINTLVNSGMSFDRATALVAPLKDWQELVIGIAITTIIWVGVTFLTKPADKKTLIRFLKTVQPSGPGWKKIIDQAKAEGEIVETEIRKNNFPKGVACIVAGCFAIYSTLFATGYWIYSQYAYAALLGAVAIISSLFIWKMWEDVTE